MFNQETMADGVENVLLSMRCCLCSNVLSVPPIISISEDGKQLKCGRCKNVKTPSKGRNFAFENIARCFPFSCIYPNCNEMISWEEVESHEDLCDKKTIICPFLRSCKEIVMVKDLEQHIIIHHDKNAHLGELSVEMTIYLYDVHLLISNEQKFFIVIKNAVSPEIYVASLNNVNERFTCNLEVSSHNEDSRSVMFKNLPINKYDERDHCFYCIYENCEQKHHPHSRLNGKIPIVVNHTKIDRVNITPVIGKTNTLRFTIVIRAKKGHKDGDGNLDDANSTVESRTTNDLTINGCVDLLRKELQCPICMQYMISSIFNCEKGHIVCETCRIELTECPSCRIELGESRSLPLENLAARAVLSCSFSKNGCMFSGKLKLLSQHEKKCQYNWLNSSRRKCLCPI